MTSMPFWNLTPWTTFGNWFSPFNRRHVFAAALTSLKSLDALLPILYLRGISTGDFQEALSALLGEDAPNLSPAEITRLTAEWQADYAAWQKRALSARRYVYV